MLGKASEIKMTTAIKGAFGVEDWIRLNQTKIIVNVLISATGAETVADYFYIIYKEGESS